MDSAFCAVVWEIRGRVVKMAARQHFAAFQPLNLHVKPLNTHDCAEAESLAQGCGCHHMFAEQCMCLSI